MMLKSLPGGYEMQEINWLTLAYFAISGLGILGAPDQSYDGGFGLVPDSESHGSVTYCAVAALWLMGLIEADILSKPTQSTQSTVIDVPLVLEWSLQDMRLTKDEVIRRCRVALRDVNLNKNCYANVLPFDNTRVVLKLSKDNKPLENAYINASFISTASTGNVSQFIATQGPLPETFEDFWEMVIQYQCPVNAIRMIENAAVLLMFWGCYRLSRKHFVIFSFESLRLGLGIMFVMHMICFVKLVVGALCMKTWLEFSYGCNCYKI